MKLARRFYQREDVVEIARDLLGKRLVSKIRGERTGGIIVETEAYSWMERGCHAFDLRKTARNKIMFATGGCAYVYLCYGIHHLFNVVTNVQGMADAVLIRALQPVQGLEIMKKRCKKKSIYRITSGPGKLTRALGITLKSNGTKLQSDVLWIEKGGFSPSDHEILASPRIGISYAGEDAYLPWRFSLMGNPWVSVPVKL